MLIGHFPCDPLMELATVFCRAEVGIDAPLVRVEVHSGNGLPKVTIVGLAQTAVKESRDRVQAALENSGFLFPRTRLTINLAPADLPKAGGRYDLAIAVGVLLVSDQLPADRVADHEFLGELGLDGSLRGIRGGLPVSLAASRAKRTLIIAEANAQEAALVSDSQVREASHLLEVCAHLCGTQPLSEPDPQALGPRAVPDLADVRGQRQARRALEVAAAGGHNLLFYGPPGTGKTMLASRLPGVLPELSESQALESASVASVSHRGLNPKEFRCRPFRSPHHSASAAALVGGGTPPTPGEISLAHNGILFLDELPEFTRHVLEMLREPLESGAITLSRAGYQVTFPARFQFVAAMNPCKCGYYGVDSRCQCGPAEVRRYRQRISGPLLDRIDMHVLMPRVTLRELNKAPGGEASETVKERVAAGQIMQHERQQQLNAQLSGGALDQFAPLDKRTKAMLENVADQLGLSTRACHRVQRVARTIADLAGQREISIQHLSEAVQYRQLDRLSIDQAANIAKS